MSGIGIVVPAINSAALAAISDPNTREVLRAVADGISVRNGDIGTGDHKFLTAADFAGGGAIAAKAAESITKIITNNVEKPGSVMQSLADALQDRILSSPWWLEMFSRIRLIDAPDTVPGSIAYLLLSEAKARHASVTTETQARQEATVSIGQRIDWTTAAIGETAAAVRTETIARATQNDAMAGQITNLAATTNGNVAAIQNEMNARTNNDNALVDAINTMWARVGNNAALVQSGTQIVVNNVGSVATKYDQLQAVVNDPVTGLVSKAAALRQEMTVTNTTINGLKGKWSVKLDLNGYVSGFSLNSGVTTGGKQESMFLVLADVFAIGAPGRPDIVPFAIDAKTGLVAIRGDLVATGSINGRHLQAKTINIDTSGIIDDLTVQTFHIGNNAVTVPLYMTGYSGQWFGAGSMRQVGAINAYYPDTVSIVALVTWQTFCAEENTNTRAEIRVSGFGTIMAQSDSAVANFTSSHCGSGKTTLGKGNYTLELWIGNDWGSGSAQLRSWSCTLLGVMK